MGVTLERVQFKFASIIGELCSEPDILSQFAVWVDLRLAEYKLKGSISLDCSGDTPEPVWLQGILSALLAKKIAQQRAVPKPSGHSYGRSPDNFTRVRSPSYKSHRPTATLNVDDTHVNVKEEPYDEGVYPVGPPSQNIADRHRKRSATVDENDTDQSDILYSHSTPKQRRSENNGNPSTESLMSIIGEGGQAENNSTLQFDSMNDTPDVMMNNENPENTSQEAGNMSDAHYGDQSSTSYDRGHTSSNLDAMASMGFGLGGLDTSGLPTMVKSAYHNHYLNYRLSGTAVDLSRRTSAAENLFGRKTGAHGGHDKNSRSSAKIFERWLQNKTMGVNCSCIETIPPKELDPLLAEFLCNIKKTSGGDYDVVSFSNLRYNIDRYLTAKGYGFSITKSTLFPQCQASFNKRRTQLRAKAPRTIERSVTANTSTKSQDKSDSNIDNPQDKSPAHHVSDTILNSSFMQYHS